MGFFRFTQYSGFVSDSWRVRPDLSLEVGLRYEYQQPMYAQGNNLVIRGQVSFETLAKVLQNLPISKN